VLYSSSPAAAAACAFFVASLQGKWIVFCLPFFSFDWIGCCCVLLDKKTNTPTISLPHFFLNIHNEHMLPSLFIFVTAGVTQQQEHILPSSHLSLSNSTIIIIVIICCDVNVNVNISGNDSHHMDCEWACYLLISLAKHCTQFDHVAQQVMVVARTAATNYTQMNNNNNQIALPLPLANIIITSFAWCTILFVHCLAQKFNEYGDCLVHGQQNLK